MLCEMKVFRGRCVGLASGEGRGLCKNYVAGWRMAFRLALATKQGTAQAWGKWAAVFVYEMMKENTENNSLLAEKVFDWHEPQS